MGTFVITKRKNEFYKYEFTSRKGKTIFVSRDFELRFECENEIEKFRNEIQAVFFMKFRSKNGKYFFRIILNDCEMAISRKYSTQLLLQKGIDEIVRTVAKSEVLDFSVQDFEFPSEEDVFGEVK